MCVMTHWCVWRDALVCVTWLVGACDVIRWCVWRDPLIRVTWLIHLWDTTHSCVRHDLFRCVCRDCLTQVTWLIHVCVETHYVCNMTHSYVDITRSNEWHDSFVCVTWLIRVRDMTHSHVWLHVLIQVDPQRIRFDIADIRAAWIIRMCTMTSVYVQHDWFIYVT